MDIQEIITVGGFFVLYTGFIFAGFSWMLKSQIKPIKELLTNHITDTDKKIDGLSHRIDGLSHRIDGLSNRLDKQSNRLDKQSDRFDRLYDFLMQEKKT